MRGGAEQSLASMTAAGFIGVALYPDAPLTPQPLSTAGEGSPGAAFMEGVPSLPRASSGDAERSMQATSPLPRGEGSGVRGGAEQSPASMAVADVISVALYPDAPLTPSPSPRRERGVRARPSSRASPVARQYNQNPSFQRMIRVLLSPQGRRIRPRGVETPLSAVGVDRIRHLLDLHGRGGAGACPRLRPKGQCGRLEAAF